MFSSNAMAVRRRERPNRTPGARAPRACSSGAWIRRGLIRGQRSPVPGGLASLRPASALGASGVTGARRGSGMRVRLRANSRGASTSVTAIAWRYGLAGSRPGSSRRMRPKRFEHLVRARHRRGVHGALPRHLLERELAAPIPPRMPSSQCIQNTRSAACGMPCRQIHRSSGFGLNENTSRVEHRTRIPIVFLST